MTFKRILINIFTIVGIFSIWVLFPKEVNSQNQKSTPTQVSRSESANKSLTPTPKDEWPDNIPVGHKEYGEWLHNQHLKNPHITGTPGALFKRKPEPESPTHFKIKPGDGTAFLTWDMMPRAIGYILYVSEDGKKFKPRIRKPFQKNEITISVLENGKTYYFGVEAIGPYGNSTKMVIHSVVPTEAKKVDASK